MPRRLGALGEVTHAAPWRRGVRGMAARSLAKTLKPKREKLVIDDITLVGPIQ